MRIGNGGRSWIRNHRVDIALVLLVLSLAAPVVQDLKTQQASRLALTAAVWDEHTLRIDGYPVGVDRAERDGHVYSDKAPGQPFFAVPAYALYRWIGGEAASHRRVTGNLGLWVVSVWSSTIPTAILLLLVLRAASRIAPEAAVPVAVVTLVATLLLPFSSVLFGHALAACLAFAGWYLLSQPRVPDRSLVAAGALLGGAVLTEYTMVIVALTVSLLAVATVGRRAWMLVAGAVPAALALVVYQWAAFGSPLAFSYASSSFGTAAAELGDERQDPALLVNGLRVLLGERGLFVVTPVVVLGVIGTIILIRRADASRAAHLAAAASAVGLVAVQVFWSNPTGGDSPGPRYATAAMAFLAPGLAIAFVRWPRWFVALGAVGAVIMVSATWTDPLEARDSYNAVGIWLGKLFDGEWALTVYEMALGRAAGIVLLPLVALCSVGVLVSAGRAAMRASAGAPQRAGLR